MNVPKVMLAARMHKVGESLSIDQLPVPVPGDEDVLVRVRSCNIVPNLLNVLRHFAELVPHMPLPPLPAIFGLDPAGEIAGIGAHVKDLRVGDRVYVNPARVCGTCRHCVDGNIASCRYYTFAGYFGFSQNSLEMFERYPWGGLAEYMVAPAYAAAKLPDCVSFDQAARFGYLGTGYAAMRKSTTGPETVALITGASGTLGIGAVISGLALGFRRILAVARDPALLNDVKAIAPDRIEVRSTNDGPIRDWALQMTDGEGVDIAVDCLPTAAPYEMLLEAFHCVRNGGVMVNCGGVLGDVPIKMDYLMNKGISLIGSIWITPRETREMAALAESGLLDLSVFEHEAYPLKDINEAMEKMGARHGGFTNYVIHP